MDHTSSIFPLILLLVFGPLILFVVKNLQSASSDASTAELEAANKWKKPESLEIDLPAPLATQVVIETLKNFIYKQHSWEVLNTEVGVPTTVSANMSFVDDSDADNLQRYDIGLIVSIIDRNPTGQDTKIMLGYIAYEGADSGAEPIGRGTTEVLYKALMAQSRLAVIPNAVRSVALTHAAEAEAENDPAATGDTIDVVPMPAPAQSTAVPASPATFTPDTLASSHQRQFMADYDRHPLADFMRDAHISQKEYDGQSGRNEAAQGQVPQFMPDYELKSPHQAPAPIDYSAPSEPVAPPEPTAPPEPAAPPEFVLPAPDVPAHPLAQISSTPELDALLKPPSVPIFDSLMTPLSPPPSPSAPAPAPPLPDAGTGQPQAGALCPACNQPINAAFPFCLYCGKNF